jgi:hypothetical protein
MRDPFDGIDSRRREADSDECATYDVLALVADDSKTVQVIGFGDGRGVIGNDNVHDGAFLGLVYLR